MRRSVSDPAAESDSLDKEVGARIRMARKARGMSQTELGEALGVTFQQVQKYERGSNRVSSSALILLARALKVSPGELLGLGPIPGSEAVPSQPMDVELLNLPGAYELLSSYCRIPSDRRQQLVLDLVDELADEVDA